MLFSVNQASHLYVAKTVSATPKNEGDIYAYLTDDKENLYFKYVGKGGILRSDLIPVDNIISIKDVEAVAGDTKLREYSLVLDGTTIVPGQDYFVRIKYSIGSIDNQYLKYGVVHGHTGMDTSAFYKALYDSLEANFKREAESPVKIVPVTTGSGDSLKYTGVKIVEVEPKWVLGTYPQRPADIEVSVDTIEVDGMEKPWGDATLGGVTASGYAVKYPNSKKIADLEYFCMGERGDQYRNYNWPNVIPVEYMVNANSTAGYGSLNIHYAYTGSNESVQKSEKDLFIVAEGDTVIRALATGVSNLLKGKKFDGSDLES